MTSTVKWILYLSTFTPIMYEEDFIKRMIQQFSKAITRLLGFVANEDYLAAEEEIAYILNDLLGVSESMVLVINEEHVIDLIFKSGEEDPQMIVDLADIFRMKGEILSDQGKPSQALQWYETSLRYLVSASDRKEFTPSIESLRKFHVPVRSLLPDGLTPNLLASLYGLFRGIEDHALASELILTFAKKTQYETEGVGEAKDYLAELSNMSEDELRRYGLSQEKLFSMLAMLP
jgi:hypothetical protein